MGDSAAAVPPPPPAAATERLSRSGTVVTDSSSIGFSRDGTGADDTAPLPLPLLTPPTRLRYFEELAAASNAINATLELETVVEVLAARTAALLEVPAASVMLVEGRQRHIRIAGSWGLSAAYVQSQAGPLERSIAGRALAENRTFATWDVRQADDKRVAEAAAREGIAAVACAPMFFAGQAVGALNLYCRDTLCFSEDQFHVLSLLAAQGAVALANARTYKESRAYAAELRASFHRVGTALSASRELGETLRLIVQLATEMSHVEAGAMFLLAEERDGGGLLLSATRGIDRRSIRRFRRVSISPVARRALDEKRAVIVPDTRHQTDTAFPTLRLASDDPTVETRSVVCVPVLARGGDKPLGVLEQYAPEPGRFSKQDIQVLSSFAAQAAVAIENARLYAQERSASQTLRRAFLPDLPATLDGFQIGRIYAPGSEIAGVGGDIYDLFRLPDGRIAVLMADVAGQGAQAATLTVIGKYTARAYAIEDPEPSSVLARVNEALIHQTGDATFLTFCYALLDPARRTVSIASAAHPPALLCQAATGVCGIVGGAPGLIAGFLPNQAYPSETVTLAPGDVLVFYTDGVVEARRRKVLFDTERLMRVVEKNRILSAQEIAAAVYTAVSEYADGPLADDIALLILKVE